MKKLAITLLLTMLSVFAFGQEAKPSSTNNLPIHLGIVLRASKATFSQQQAAAIELVQTLIRNPGDEAFVISAGGDHGWPYPRLDWDSKADSLVKFIKSMDKNAGMPEAFGFHIEMSSVGNYREWLTTYKGASPDASVFAVVAAMMKSDPQPAHRVVIMFRDPWDHSPGWGGVYSEAVQHRHDYVISMLKQAGVSAYIIGIDDPVARPQMPSELASSYNGTHAGEGSSTRVFDQEFRKRLDQMTAQGRTNAERIAKETGGEIVYGTKKNYSDAVPAIESKLSSSAPAAAAGK